MPYQLTGILKLPDGTPAANVDIEFVSHTNYSPLVRDLSNTIRTSDTGSYSIELEYGEYAIRLLYASAYPLHPGKIYVYADTPSGQDLPTLMQAANWTPTTPDYIVQIQNWLVEAKAAHDGSMASAAEAKASELAAKASEVAVEADRAEVAASKAAVSASQADVTTKQADVAAKATQVASDKAAADAAKVAAVSASTSASSSASSASASASAAATSAANSESSALRAEAAAGSLVVEEIPFPDVWIPFSDSLVMLAGYGDEVKVGSYVVAKMASFSRASGATYIDKSSALRTAAVNEPRFEKEGLLIEGQSTNLLLNSGALSTQSVTVAGGSYTLSFYGSGSVTLSGAATGTLVGGGAGRSSLSVTAIAGTLVLTVSGTCANAQLEALPFATSYIPTNGAAATRAADLCNIPTTNNTAYFDKGHSFALSCEFDSYNASTNSYVYSLAGAGATNGGYLMCQLEPAIDFINGYYAGSGSHVKKPIAGERSHMAFSVRWNGSGEAAQEIMCNGATYGRTITSPAVTGPGANLLYFGCNGSSGSRALFGHIRNFRIWHRALTDSQLKSIR